MKYCNTHYGMYDEQVGCAYTGITTTKAPLYYNSRDAFR